jgi:hypothetical protein
MNKEQIWALLEIKELLCDSDRLQNDYGLNLLVEFIEENCFKIEVENA